MNFINNLINDNHITFGYILLTIGLILSYFNFKKIKSKKGIFKDPFYWTLVFKTWSVVLILFMFGFLFILK